MSKKETITISHFAGGISDDPRLESSDSFAMARHFDISDTKRLVPLHGTVANETKAMGIKKFLYAPFGSASTFRLYGYGVKAGAGTYPALYIYDIDAGNPDGTSWATPATAESAVNGRNTNAFFYYKNYIYMWTGANSLTRWNVLTAALTDNYQTIAFTNIAQPVHHRADDVAYFFADNIVYSLNDATWATALTLPSNYYIANACSYGNYLAILCNPLTSNMAGNPIVYLWDRDSSLATLTERIDLGQGTGKYIAEINGQLIVVSDFFTNNAYGLNQNSVIVKRIVGNQAITIKTLPTDSTSTLLYSTSLVKGDKLYFPAKLINDGDTNMGIYSVDVYGRMNLEVYDADCTSFEGIYTTGNMWWIAHSGDGSVNRSVVDGTFGTSSIYESQKFNGGDSSLQKHIIGVAVTTDPMPSAGSVVCKYRVDAESSWTTIFTYSTDNGIAHSAINVEATGAPLPTFYEGAIRLESTGGAIITGLKVKYEILDNSIF